MIRQSLLYPGDAVAALLMAPDGRYILQQRDTKDGIFFPGFWGNFGGAIEPGETPAEALVREIREEVGISIAKWQEFCRLILDFRYASAGEVARHFFVVDLSEDQVSSLVVREGIGHGLFAGREILEMPRIVPYDSLVIWQHCTRDLIGGRYRGER